MPRPCGWHPRRGRTRSQPTAAQHPDLIPALKACGRTRDLDTARKLHCDAIADPSGSDIYVETSLVAMYAKCGSMGEARAVFDAMPRRNAVSWTALIAGYTENRDPDYAIAAFYSMRAAGCEADATTFVSVVNSLCSKMEADRIRFASGNRSGEGDHPQMPRKGIHGDCREPRNMALIAVCMEIHALARRHESDLFVSSALLDMYAKLRSVYDARIVFDRMPGHDVVSWTTLMLAYIDSDDHQLALELFDRMPARCDPDARTLVAAIMAVTGLAAAEPVVETDPGKSVKPTSLERCRAIHSLAADKGFVDDIFVASKLVDSYSKCGSVDEAWNVFQAMPARDLVAWSSMVMGFAENGDGYRALDCFHRLEQSMEPDSRSFTAAVAAAASLAAQEPGREIDGRVVKLEAMRRGMEIHARAERKTGWCRTDVFLANSLIGMYSKCGSMIDAQRVFDRMTGRTAVSWSSLILGYVENGDEYLALELFRGAKPVLWPSPPCERSYVAALMACSGLAALETGRALHREISQLGYAKDVYLGVALVDLYGKCGSMAEAEAVFGSMTSGDDNRIAISNKVAWSALAAGYSRQGDVDRAVATFERMRAAGVDPCAVIFVSLLSACSHAGLVDRGREIFSTMVQRYRIAPLAEHYNCLVDMLGRANLLDEALDIARRSSTANAATWKILLGSCHKWNNVGIARVAFEALVEMDPRQDVAYVVMAGVLGSAGLWEEQAMVLERRGKAGTWKKAGQSWWTCPRTGVVHRFRAGDDASRHPQGEAIAGKMRELVVEMKGRHGYVAATGRVTHNIAEAEKEGTLCCHSERLAIACALVNTPAGEAVRIVKNLRVCEDCHRVTGIISRIERRVIVCRDTSRFHVFENGECSCHNFW